MVHFLVRTREGVFRQTAEEHLTILEALRTAGFSLETDCNGTGSCGRCLVRATRMGAPLPPVPLENRTLGARLVSEDFRLACRHTIAEGLELTIDPPSDGDMLYKSSVNVPLSLATTSSPLECIPFEDGTLEDSLAEKCGVPSPDWISLLPDAVEERFLDARPEPGPPARGIMTTTGPTRKALAVVSLPCRPLGVAVDLGTTTIASYLCEPADGIIRDVLTVRNPQWRYGSDVITRITAAQDPEVGAKMQCMARDAISECIGVLCRRQGRSPDDVLAIDIVGNPTMIHILLGAPTRGLAFSPYRPVFRSALELRARDMGLRAHAGALVCTLPQPSAYIGGDALAAWLWVRDNIDKKAANLLLDLGTNGEMLLSANGELCATSCATGPAFEGGGISSGMPGVKGAVDIVRLFDDKVEYHVIDQDKSTETRVTGVCGSGAISALAEMLRKGWMAPDGRLLRSSVTGEQTFIIAPGDETSHGEPVQITQKDIRALQLAKSAVATGIRFLCHYAGIEKPDRIYLAGAFGNVISPRDAVTLGIVPPIPPSRILGVGNAAGLGACKALLDRKSRELAGSLHNKIQVIEMGEEREFQDIFLQNLDFAEPDHEV